MEPIQLNIGPKEPGAPHVAAREDQAATNRIADDLIRLLAPRWLLVEAEFHTRGGLSMTVRMETSGPDR
ncbi:hypothetical protein ACFL6M_03865 [Candidatus Eisenbacteria bacterium]|uniref:Uncharacterized protein n=1 Tax=Eiseniibacteriota bacterium TaxID=2212470 RepID=A0ABV6YKP5_UNCEI